MQTAVALLVVSSAGVGQAASVSIQEDSCIVTLDTGSVRCYETLAKMVAVETVGRYRLPASGAFTPNEVVKFDAALKDARTATAARGSEVAPAALGVNATFWDGQNYTGGALVLEASAGCGSSAWVWNSLVASWQDRVESGKGYRNCEFKVWANPGLTGISFGYFLSATGLLNLNNEVESVRLQ